MSQYIICLTKKTKPTLGATTSTQFPNNQIKKLEVCFCKVKRATEASSGILSDCCNKTKQSTHVILIS